MTPSRIIYSVRYRCSNCGHTWNQSIALDQAIALGQKATLIVCPCCKWYGKEGLVGSCGRSI